MGTALNDLKDILSSAKKLRNFEAISDKARAAGNVDKFGAGFVANTDRFVSMQFAGVCFTTWSGVYGNSGCSTFFGVSCDRASLQAAFLHSLNTNRQAIFDSMADHLDEKARETATRATEEVRANAKLLADCGIDIASIVMESDELATSPAT